MGDMELVLWFLAPFAAQIVLLGVSRDRLRPLRFALLIPLGLAVPAGLIAAVWVVLANYEASGNDLVFTVLNLLALVAGLFLLPHILLRLGLFALGWALAWAVYALRSHCHVSNKP